MPTATAAPGQCTALHTHAIAVPGACAFHYRSDQSCSGKICGFSAACCKLRSIRFLHSGNWFDDQPVCWSPWSHHDACRSPLNSYNNAIQCSSPSSAVVTPPPHPPYPPRPPVPVSESSQKSCFLSVGKLGSNWTQVSALSCSGCQQSCSDTTSCYYYVWSNSLNCAAADGNSCPRLVGLQLCQCKPLQCLCSLVSLHPSLVMVMHLSLNQEAAAVPP